MSCKFESRPTERKFVGGKVLNTQPSTQLKDYERKNNRNFKRNSSPSSKEYIPKTHNEILIARLKEISLHSHSYSIDLYTSQLHRFAYRERTKKNVKSLIAKMSRRLILDKIFTMYEN